MSPETVKTLPQHPRTASDLDDPAEESAVEGRPKLGGKISVVVPVYRSKDSLPILVERLVAQLGTMGHPFEIVLIDDHSPDESWSVLRRLKARHQQLKIVRLLRNRGQHNAILCGLSLVTGDIIITMDDDLQNPPEEIPKLVEAIEQGYDLAIGAYDLKKHGQLRNIGGGLVDHVQRRIFDLPPDFQLTSFRAIRRIVVDHVNKMAGAFPYVTSMLLSHTSSYVNVPVRHEPRQFGRSNYSVKRSFLLALNLLLTYSDYPLCFVGLLCSLAFLASVGFGLYIFGRVLFFGSFAPGWASTVVILAFFNSLILLAQVILGIYVSRINQQVTRSCVSFSIGELYE
jgi:glycosyltransferase involved in cell wall biosynthesis